MCQNSKAARKLPAEFYSARNFVTATRGRSSSSTSVRQVPIVWMHWHVKPVGRRWLARGYTRTEKNPNRLRIECTRQLPASAGGRQFKIILSGAVMNSSGNVPIRNRPSRATAYEGSAPV